MAKIHACSFNSILRKMEQQPGEPEGKPKGGAGWINPTIQSKIAWRDDDVVVSVPLKSGTTWTMNIVHQLREKGDRGFDEIYEEVKWIETMRSPDATVEEMVKAIDDMPDNWPRAFKSHAPPPMLPFKDSVKYVVVMRNPEEAVVSMKSFSQKHSPEFLKFWGMPPDAFQWPDFETYYNAFVGGMGVDKMIFGFAASWWKLRNKPNVLMLHYKEMVSDHEGSIKKISDFLDYGPYTEEEWSTILEVTSFQWMKKHETRFEVKTVWPIPALQRGAMIRQGSFGLARQDGMSEELANDLAERGRKICTDEKAFDWLYNGGELPPDDEISFLSELIVTSSKTFRRVDQLSDKERAQLSLIINSPKYAFGNPKDVRTVEDCFNRRNVDDGIVFYKEMAPRGEHESQTSYFYWLGYFGGNPTGYLLDGKNQFVIHNCDTDFIWVGPGECPNDFIRSVKKAAYGDKYQEEEE